MFDAANCIYLNNQKVNFLVSEDGCWMCIGRYVTKKGYVQISWRGKATLVHRVVYQYFHETNLPTHIHVRHLCGNPCCMNLEHLAKGTAKQNSDDKKIHGTQPLGEQVSSAKLYEAAVRDIRNSGDKTVKELAAKYNVSQSCIRSVLSRKTWKHVKDGQEGSKKKSERMPDKPPAKRNDNMQIDKELLKITKPLN